MNGKSLKGEEEIQEYHGSLYIHTFSLCAKMLGEEVCGGEVQDGAFCEWRGKNIETKL